MIRGRWLLIITMIAGASQSAPAAAEHYAISAALIAATVSNSGVQISADQVTLLSQVIATTPAPLLHVRSVEKLGSDRLLARLECEKSEECLPFFVSLQVSGGSEAQTAAVAKLLPIALPRRTAASSIALHAGSHAMLRLEGAHIHISIPVICLQNGAPGQTVRVTDMRRRVVYTAEVVDGFVVEGRLQ
jgi:hypothetical protein